MPGKKVIRFCLFAWICLLPGLSMAWQPKQAALMTDWAQQVSTNNPWPEYPRPQMVRTNWLSLNGIWKWQPGATNDPLPSALSGEILVPFPMESALSGVKQHHDWAWYRRTFTVPSGWAGQHVLLNFGAVNWRAEVFINGVSVGVHEGGYDAFSFDITSYLTGSGPQTLTIRVWSPVDNTDGYTFSPIGKQRINPGGMCYTSSSGIWQSVWIEPVPATRIADMHLVPDIDNNRLRVNVTVSGPTNGIGVKALAQDGSTHAVTASGAPGTDFYVSIPSAKLWWPTNPFLYDLQITLTNSSGAVDSVASYFGMRKVGLINSGGFVKVGLNNSALFCTSPLDQGYWPDGIYTPPSELAMRADLELIRAFGWNAVRKHLKVESDRWYYWCDKMGLPVWQDMASLEFGSVPNTPQSLTTFSNEMTRMIVTHWNHPSIIVWSVYNEGGAMPDANTASNVVKNVVNLDPSRLVNGNSGHGFVSPAQINDLHNYPDPACNIDTNRAVVCGEYGGLGYYIKGHEWSGSGFSYLVEPDSDTLLLDFERFCYIVSDLINNKGLCGAVYTENCDVENEENGLYTYDRKVMKADPRQFAAAMQIMKGQYSYSNVVPSSKLAGQTWSYTTNPPPANWYAINFDSSSWSAGQGAFGTNAAGLTVRTPWTTSDIWLRRTFNPGNLTAQQISNLVFSVCHDEDFEIYINGVVACRSANSTKEYFYLSMLPQARAAIIPNATNYLAVHCNQSWGGQGIDVGIDLRTTVVAPPALASLPSWTENGSGLRGEYFGDTNLSNSVMLRSDPNIAFDWGSSSPGVGLPTNRFSVRWTGQIQPRYSEVYTFHLAANDGCRLWVDGQQLINQWRNDLATNDLTGSIALMGGQKYDIRLEYCDNTNGASVKLEWNSANQLREIVPQGVLFPNGSTETNAAMPPTAPSALAATPVSYSLINLSWTDNANDETQYVVERSLTPGSGYTQVATLGANATSYNDSNGLVHGTSYYYRVHVYNAWGEGVSMEVGTATPFNPDIPLAPSNLAAAVVSSNQIALSWSDNSSNETGFKIQRKTGAGGIYSQIALVNSNTISYTDDNSLVAGTLYYYRICSTSSYGDSTYSAEVGATTCPVNSVFWTGAMDSSWTTSGNWLNAPVSSKTVVYNSSSIDNLKQSLGQNWSIGGIVIGNPAGNITINAGYTLSNAGGIDMSSATKNLTNNAPQVLLANQTWAVAGSAVLTNSGAIANSGYTLTIDCATNATTTTNVYQYGSISGSGKVVKLGQGTVVWGTQGSYTNATFIGGGVVMSRGGGMNGLGANWAPITITGNALYSLNGSSLNVGTLTLSNGKCGINRNGNINLSNVISSGVSMINLSEVRPGADLAGGIYTALFNVVDGTLTLAINKMFNNNATADGTLVKSGGGTMIITNWVGSYRGATIVSNGTLVMSGTLTNSSTLSILRGATLQLADAKIGVATVTNAAGGLLCGYGTISNLVVNSGTLVPNGAMSFCGALTNNGTITVPAGTTVTFNGPVVNNGTVDSSGGGVVIINSTWTGNPCRRQPSPWLTVEFGSDGLTRGTFAIQARIMPNQNCVLEESPNLVDWLPAQSSTATAEGEVNFTISVEPTGCRFYRLKCEE